MSSQHTNYPQTNFSATAIGGGAQWSTAFHPPQHGVAGPVFPVGQSSFILPPPSAYAYSSPPQDHLFPNNIDNYYEYLRPLIETEIYYHNRQASYWQQINNYIAYHGQRSSNNGFFPGSGLMNNWFQRDETIILGGTTIDDHNHEHVREDNNYDNRGLSDEEIERWLKTRNIPCHDEDEICAVCLDDLREENQAVGVLECGHEYHAGCIKRWLRRKNVCPLCKAIALPAAGR